MAGGSETEAREKAMTSQGVMLPRSDGRADADAGLSSTDGAEERRGLAQVVEVLRRGRRFAVCSHARPDGDAVGAMLACGLMLEQMGKRAELVAADPVPQIYRGLPGAGAIRRLERLEGRFLVNIDHHASGRRFADVNWIDTEACAVAEMVYRLARAAGAPVTQEMARCLYVGVLTDTGSFCYEGTDWHAFEVARELVKHGADPAAIAREVYFSNPMSKMMLLGAALGNLRRDGKLAWLWVTHADMQRTGAAEEDCEGIVNYAIAISGVEAAVLVRELPDGRVRLSLRSKGRLDVAQVAASFGGGGHIHAGGCTLEGPLEEARTRILERMRREVAMASSGEAAKGE